MEIKVIRFSPQVDSTSGIMLIDNEFVAYTLEDEERDEKVYGETCIPAGKYEIKYRKVGGFHTRYSERFKSIHKGMLELQNVKNFQFILIHCGNTDENTAGCILIGDSQENNLLIKNGFIGKSTQAYKRVYKEISDALESGEKVTIEIIKLQDLFNTVYLDVNNKSKDHMILADSVYEKLQDINGQLLTLNSKLDRNNII